MGGHAFKTKCDSVSKQEASIIVTRLSTQLGIDFHQRLLGSTCLKEISNDLDLAISPHEEHDILEWATSRRYDTKVLPDMVHVRYPYFEKFVQLDFLKGDLNWLKFYYRQGESAYSGEDRAVLLNAIAKNLDLVESTELDDFGRPAIIRRWKLGNRGMVRVERRSIVVDGRTVKKQRDFELSEHITDVAKIGELLFGDASADMRTCESLISLINKDNTYRDALSEFQKSFENKHAKHI